MAYNFVFIYGIVYGAPRHVSCGGIFNIRVPMNIDGVAPRLWSLGSDLIETIHFKNWQPKVALIVGKGQSKEGKSCCRYGEKREDKGPLARRD